MVVNRGPNRPDGRARWYCRCGCGVRSLVSSTNLVSTKTQSCGCLHREVTAAQSTKHGYAARGRHHPLYEVWWTMIERCQNPHVRSYPNYGGRAITVCARWRRDFAAFLADMGERPAGTSIDRINNDGDYEPGNCRWATPKEQAANKRPRPNPRVTERSS